MTLVAFFFNFEANFSRNVVTINIFYSFLRNEPKALIIWRWLLYRWLPMSNFARKFSPCISRPLLAFTVVCLSAWKTGCLKTWKTGCLVVWSLPNRLQTFFHSCIVLFLVVFLKYTLHYFFIYIHIIQYIL